MTGFVSFGEVAVLHGGDTQGLLQELTRAVQDEVSVLPSKEMVQSLPQL